MIAVPGERWRRWTFNPSHRHGKQGGSYLVSSERAPQSNQAPGLITYAVFLKPYECITFSLTVLVDNFLVDFRFFSNNQEVKDLVIIGVSWNSSWIAVLKTLSEETCWEWVAEWRACRASRSCSEAPPWCQPHWENVAREASFNLCLSIPPMKVSRAEGRTPFDSQSQHSVT